MNFRTRLFATYALIVIICLGLLAIVVTLLLQGYRDRLTMERLDNIARPISVQVRSLSLGQVTSRDLWSNLEEQAKRNNVYIILGSNEGIIIKQISPANFPNQQLIEVSPGGLPQNIVKATQGRFEALDGRTYIFAAYPLGGVTSAVASQTDTLFISVPRTGSVAILASLLRPFLLAGIVALVLSLLLAFIFARSVSNPLRRVTVAARKIAQGDYDQKIPVTGPAEFTELATDFNDMAKKVKQSQQQLRHFVADVSHELKSPITSIQGFAQALVDGTAKDNVTKQKAANIINEESKRMRRQVDELLELARMQSSQLKIVYKPVIIKEIIEQCYELFSVQTETKGVAIKIDVDPSLVVLGDADRLEQLFGNLLDNAIKNSHADSDVYISGHQLNDDLIEVKVTDSGPGIPPEQLPYVFERFYQVTGVRTGVGLGLAIAKEIVLSHNGTIEARSRPGEGAEFIVRLPKGNPA